MTNELKEKIFRYTLRALPNGKYNFVQFDPEYPKAPGELLLSDKTENEVRELYRAKWNYSGAEIDERLQTARRELEESGRK